MSKTHFHYWEERERVQFWEAPRRAKITHSHYLGERGDELRDVRVTCICGDGANHKLVITGTTRKKSVTLEFSEELTAQIIDRVNNPRDLQAEFAVRRQRKPNVPRDLAKEDGRNVPAAVNRDRRCAAVGMAELFV